MKTKLKPIKNIRWAIALHTKWPKSDPDDILFWQTGFGDHPEVYRDRKAAKKRCVELTNDEETKPLGWKYYPVKIELTMRPL